MLLATRASPRRALRQMAAAARGHTSTTRPLISCAPRAQRATTRASSSLYILTLTFIHLVHACRECPCHISEITIIIIKEHEPRVMGSRVCPRDDALVARCGVVPPRVVPRNSARL